MRLFQTLDFLTFGLPSAAVTGLTLYAGMNGVENQALLLLIAVSVVFNFIYGVLIYYRWTYIRRIEFSIYGIDVIPNGHPVTKEAMQKEVDDLISKWAVVLKSKGCKNPHTLIIEAIDGITIFWEDFPIKNRWGTFAGLAWGKDSVQVGYKENIGHSSFSHEVGHFLYAAWSGEKLENPKCHKFMAENKLP